MSALAKRVLELDRKYPGDPESSMDLPSKVWAELVELARAEGGDSSGSWSPSASTSTRLPAPAAQPASRCAERPQGSSRTQVSLMYLMNGAQGAICLDLAELLERLEVRR